MSVFGERLRELRMRADMSQETVAVLLGASAQAVSKWENGKNYPDIPSLISLASLFHVSVDELLGNKNRIHDLETAWRSILKTADERKKLDFLKEAVSEYPGHSMFKYKLACEEYFVAENESDPGKRIQI